MPNKFQPPMRPDAFAKSLVRCLPLLSRPLTRPRRKANVLMLHFGRCGSTAIGNLLQQHSEIAWDSEILQRRKQNLLPECAITRNPKRLICLRSLRASRPIFGFEIKPLPFMHLSSDQLNMGLPQFFAFMRELKITHLIFLGRKHYLRQLISVTVAVEKNRYEASPGKTVSLNKVQINCENTLGGGNQIKNLFDCYDSLAEAIRKFGRAEKGMQFLELEYQRDVLGSPIYAFDLICDFLKIERGGIDLKNAKVNSASLTDILGNLNEVHDALKNTPYEWMTNQDEQVPTKAAEAHRNTDNYVAA